MAVNLLPASFRGVPFLTDGHSLSGGRKVVLHDYVNSNKRGSEDLGRESEDYEFTAVVQTHDGFSRRDALKTALETSGPGVLVHPYFGSVLVILSERYQLTETWGAQGKAEFRLKFAQTEDALQPFQFQSSKADVVAAVAAAQEAAADAFAADFNPENKSAFLASSDKAKSKVTDAFNTAKSKLAGAVAKAGAFNQAVRDKVGTVQGAANEIIGNVTALLNAPRDFASSFISLYQTVDLALDSVEASVDAYKNMLEKPRGARLATGTPDAVAAANNAAALDALEATNAVAMLSANGAAVEWSNTDALLATASTVMSSIDALSDEANQDAVVSALADLKAAFQSLVDAALVSTPRVSTRTVATTSVEELAYALYGDIDAADTLTDMNQFRDNARISGTIKVLVQ